MRNARYFPFFMVLALGVAMPLRSEMAAGQKPPPRSAGPARRVEPRHDPFATRAIDYSPAPGQFVDDPRYNDPLRALGAPIGGGTLQPDLSKLVSLGGFGGSITLGFDRTIRDDPANPGGLDFIVFGNSHWLGLDPALRFVEAATVEIGRDVNRNGAADDPWYVIPGSHIHNVRKQRQNGLFILPDDPFADVPMFNPNVDGTEEHWGYADMNPVLRLGDFDGDNLVDDPVVSPEEFYTVPDDPRVEGITFGSGGGDAFDIAWAVDPITGAPAHLDGFDFVRITTAVDEVVGIFGEISAEIGGVAAVRAGSW